MVDFVCWCLKFHENSTKFHYNLHKYYKMFRKLPDTANQTASQQPANQTTAAAVELSSNHNLDNERQHWGTAKCQSQLMFSRGKTTTGKTSGQQRNLLPYFIDQYFVVGASIFRTNNMQQHYGKYFVAAAALACWVVGFGGCSRLILVVLFPKAKRSTTRNFS